MGAKVWVYAVAYGGEPDADASEVWDLILAATRSTVFRTREAAVARVEAEMLEAAESYGAPGSLPTSGLDAMDLALEARTDLPDDREIELYWEDDVCRVRGLEEDDFPPTGIVARGRLEG